MFTNNKREGINRFVCDVSLYVAETSKASIKYHKPPLPIIPFGIVAYSFVGQPFSKQLYINYVIMHMSIHENKLFCRLNKISVLVFFFFFFGTGWPRLFERLITGERFIQLITFCSPQTTGTRHAIPTPK